MVLLAGALGLMAAGYGVPPEQASVALFALANEVMPTWALMLVLILSLALVMSSMDTLINGITSTMTSDLSRWRSHLPSGQLLRIARVLTVIVAIPSILIASQGYSVLYLFLIADLVCAGAVFPVFYGLYSRQFSGNAALISSAVGIVAGLLFFPKPDFTPLVPIPLAGSFLVSFGAALVISTGLALVLSQVTGSNRTPYDFSILEQRVHSLK
jgi:Na+/proline symporter